MDIPSLLGEAAESLLEHECKTFERESLTLPGPDFVDRALAGSDRSPQVLRSYCGATCATRRSRWTAPTTTPPPT